MNRENGFAYQILVLIIIIIIAIAGVLINKVIGKNGMVDKAVTVETEYGKEEVLEKINYKITQKFIELNNIAKENNQNIFELYNSDVVIAFLQENHIILPVQDEEGNVIEGRYDIDVDTLTDENENLMYSGTFQLEKQEEKYIVVYYDLADNREEIGELQIQQT